MTYMRDGTAHAGAWLCSCKTSVGWKGIHQRVVIENSGKTGSYLRDHLTRKVASYVLGEIR